MVGEAPGEHAPENGAERRIPVAAADLERLRGGCPEGDIRHLLPGSRLSGRRTHRKTARVRFRRFAR